MRSFEECRVCPGFPAYCVTESGMIGRIGKTEWLKSFPMKRGGYLAVSLWRNGKGKTRPIHQLVALAFRGPKPSPAHQAAHDDGDKGNNHWRNLHWKTRKENEADKIRHGTDNRGERNGQAKLTNAQAEEVRLLAAQGSAQASIAKLFGISSSAVSNIVRGKRRGQKS